TAVQTDTGTLQIDLGGNSFSAGLTGTGINFQYSYQMITSTGSSSFSPSQAVSLPDTQVGTTTSVTVRVQNTGTAVGTIAAIATTNGPFTLANLPILPKTLNPNDIAMFTLSFTPTQTGKNTATLQIGNDLFTLTGNGLGPKLDFSYGSALPTVVQNGGAVIFSPVQVGQTATLPFTVTNDGTTPGQLASIAVTDTKGIFTVSNLPSLPITLKPGDTFTFNVSFTPALTGITTSILEIDTQTFNLSGSGTAPPALPAVQFTGASGAVNAFSQPAIGLSLASPYPLAVSGTLTISISSQFNPDPTVQFGTGGKTVQFTIPANSTEAVFARGSNQALLQSGTTASMITISAALATASGLDLTPSPAPSVLLTVSSAAPTLLSVILTSESSTSFALQITGFSTTHSLTNLNFQFTTTGVNIPTGGVSVDVSAAASNWYASTTSQPFAGQFLISMPFILTQGSSSSTTSLVSEIQSATVTASNAQGASNTLSIPIAGP
ncbi:MAG TPA: choice-of-anchor D domain-containing protein, partial [Bryobacteraceae bacterium]|nr:choice-of-anchor D domain-containing protein [Bryobacteraceae bacterium]